MDKNIIVKILDSQENGIIILNKHKKVLYANKTTRTLLGNDVNQPVGDYFNCKYTIKENTTCQMTSNCNNCTINKAINRVIQTKRVETLNNIELEKNNIEVTLSMKISLCEEHILIEMFNLSIKNFKMDFLIMLADKSKDIMFFKNEKLKYTYVNKTYAEFFNKEKDYLIGKTDYELEKENILSTDLYEQCLVGDKESIENGYYYGIEAIGSKYFRVSKENIDGGILGIARDITNEVNAIKKSETDQLTGMYNRHKFDEIIKEIYLNNKTSYYMALIDLDDLRSLNNIHGHLKGDNYLKALSNILKSQEDSMFFRIGGDEFVGIIDSDKNCPEKIFKKIFKDINSLNLTPKLSISVGIKKLDLSENYEKNYELADNLLYQVKRCGKNNFIIN